jgi:hypothetical protein
MTMGMCDERKKEWGRVGAGERKRKNLMKKIGNGRTGREDLGADRRRTAVRVHCGLSPRLRRTR